MPINKINGITYSNIAKIGGKATSQLAKMGGQTLSASAPPATATRWVGVTDYGYVIYASNSDRTSWSQYDGVYNATPRAFDIGFGKNSNGDGIYICSRGGAVRELQVSSVDVTTDANWTDVNISPNDTAHCVMWGARSDGSTAGTWMAIGEQDNGNAYRSIDGGANWSAVDLSGLSGHGTGTSGDVKGIASNGLGKWVFAQGPRLYISTDDGASFSVSTPWSSDTPQTQQGITYTNSTWVIAYSRGGRVKLRCASDSDLTDWSDEYDPYTELDNGETMANPDNVNKRSNICSANGRVCVISTGHDLVTYFDVNGKVISNVGQNDLSDTTSLGGDTARDICTDGSTWMISMMDGDIWESTDNGVTWARTVNGLSIAGATNRDIQGITCDVILPL
tara:strand:+ start:957 stop:2135 length:1179 start_codon:yes stop_codon:yes gene_type:complete